MGRPLPYLEQLAETYWGASELEHVIDELKKRDNVSWNIAMLTFMANLRVMKMDGMGQLLATGNEQAQIQLYNTIQGMNAMMNNNSLQVLGENDSYETHQYTFGGIGETYDRFMMDVAGAAETPVTKLFGRSPAGMNATGESDMQNYYDTIEETSDTTAHQPSISTYHVSGNVKLYAFNDKAFISLNTSESTIEETKQLAKQYLSQTKDKSYVATPAFRDLEDQKGDIRGVLSMTKFLESSYGKSMTENIVGLSDATNFDGIDMKKCYMLYSVSFETGEVVGTMTYGSEDKEILKKLKKLAEEVSPRSVQDDLVKFLPKDSYMTAAASLSVQKLIEHYSKLPGLKEALSNLKEEGVDIEAIAPTLGEEFAFTCPHINAEQADFGLVVYLKTKDATLVDMLYQQAEKEHSGRYVKDGGDHRYRIAEGSFFFGYQDGVTYLVYGGMGREQLFKTSGENFTKHSDYSSLKKSNSFCYIDLKKLLTTAPTADLLQRFIGEKAKAFRVLQSLSFTATNIDGKMSLKIDSKENSLKTLADLFVALR